MIMRYIVENHEEKMIYESLKPVARASLLEAVRIGDARPICSAIDSLAEFDKDWHWLHDQSIELLEHSSWRVRAAAARSLGTLARVHRDMPVERAIAALSNHLSDTKIAGYIEDALDDIEIFQREE